MRKITCWKCTVEFAWGRPQTGRGPKNPKYDLYITNLVNFIIQIVWRVEMAHSYILPTAPSYSMHILTYIKNMQMS